MLVLGLLLILGAAVITAGAFFDAGETATVEVLGQTLTTTAAGVFVIGALTMLVFLLGVWCLMAAMSRGRRRRQERKAAKSQHRDSVRSLEEERESLRLENERLAEQLNSREHTGAPAGTAAAAGTAGAVGGAAATDRDHDGVDDRTEPGHRSFMDRVTGRHDSSSTTGASSTDSTTSSTVPTGTSSDDGYRSDRVIDHETDLREHDSTGQHRQV